MKEVVVFYHDHLDPQWSRCYDRPAFDGDIQLRSYSDVWDWVLESWLELADEGYPYAEGQTLVWRTYLARRPERLERLRELIRRGTLQIPLQGEMTVETNYTPAEGLARNFLLARPVYEQLCGLEHEGLEIAWIWDDFGQSASYPQLLQLAGAKTVGGNKYRPCPDDYWQAIDGTKLPCFDKHLGNIYYVCRKHPHCKSCAGAGCDACGGRGMTQGRSFDRREIAAVLEKAAREPEAMSFVYIGGEEILPDRAVLDVVAEMNRSFAGKVAFRFGQLTDLWKRDRAEALAGLDAHRGPVGDLNPVHQGCYVTRIENKQRTHAVAAALVRAEGTLADRIYRGEPPQPAPALDSAWRGVLLNMHHDSISGAHIDSGQDELMELLDDAERIAWNHGGFLPPRLPGDSGFREVRGQCVKRLGNIDVTFDREGIVAASVDGVDPFGDYRYRNISFYGNDSPRIHIGELVLQCEWGDNHNAYHLGDPVALGGCHLGVWQSADAIRWQGRHNTGDPLVKTLAWTTTVRASEDGNRLDFTIEVDWDTCNLHSRNL